MDINDYKNVFASTSVCMTNDPVKYKHSNVYHSMTISESAFFKFTLESTIDLDRQCFGKATGSVATETTRINLNHRFSAFFCCLKTESSSTGRVMKTSTCACTRLTWTAS